MGKKIGIVVALIGAVVLGWWLISGYRKPDAPIETPKPTPVVTAGSGSAKPDVKPKQDTGGGGMQGGNDRVMIDDDPKGDERLEGQVIDADDHPVAGAVVSLSSHPPRTVKSGEDGAFVFDQVVLRPYTLSARSKEGVAGPITARLTKKSEPVVLKLRAGSKVVVTVVGTDQKPIEKATVELRSREVEDLREMTDKAGVATFANTLPGGYQIAAWADGKPKAFQFIGVGDGVEEARIVLQAGARVAGIVVDEAGKPVADARVRFSGASDWNQQGAPRLDDAVTTAEGKWEFAAMPAGSFRFIASNKELAPGSSALVTLDGKTAQESITITMPAGAVVRGKVVDAAKQPVAAARVKIGPDASSRGMIFEAPRQTYSDATGSFEMRGLPRKALAAVAMHESGASQTVDVDTTRGDAEITLTIDVTGTISGIVVDPSGTPMPDMQVSAGPNFSDTTSQKDFSQWRLRGFPEELTDSAGKFTLSGLATGTYTVSATPAKSAGRSNRFMGGGGISGTPQTATTGDTNVRIVVPAEGSVKGKVQFADGKAPSAFSISIGFSANQSFIGTSDFAIEDLPPNKYQLSVRGPSFQTRVVEVTVESSKTTDAGTITVEIGRTIGGVVLADGNPVAGATVHVGRQVFGNGSSSNANFGPMGGNTKHDTTDENGKFLISGFPEGDITIVAESEVGRSKAIRLPTTMPGQTELTLNLEKFGALSGVVKQGDKPAEGLFVSLTSTTAPGVIYGVASGPDGSYRYDKLAPDTYKVSAMIGMPMTGMKFYSKNAVVPSGGEVKVDLAAEPGNLSLEVSLTTKTGKAGGGYVVISSVPLVAHTLAELQLRSAALGPSKSQFAIMRGGVAKFDDVGPGTYSVCAVPYPLEVKGMMPSIQYPETHGDSLLASCKSFPIAAAPTTQTVTFQVELPPYIPDAPAGGGSGSAAGSGSGRP